MKELNPNILNDFNPNVPKPKAIQSSPLHAAGYYEHTHVCALLLYDGADPTLKNSLGLTAKQDAQGKGMLTPPNLPDFV